MKQKKGGVNVFITMLGVGNGFSRGVHNNNALVECNGEKTMIDCGITAWESLEQLGPTCILTTPEAWRKRHSTAVIYPIKGYA